MANVIGQNTIRLDAAEKARGKAKYAADFTAPDLLHLALVRSSLPHAQIIKIDTSCVPANCFVYTASDLAHNVLPSILNDQPALAAEKVRFFGEAIAVIAADSLAAAQAAAAAVTVQYEALPIIKDARTACDKTSALLFSTGNLCGDFHFCKGDPESAFHTADLVVQDHFSLPCQEHAYLETESCFAEMQEGVLTLYPSTQNTFVDQETVCCCLGLSKEKVRVIAPAVGGGFGGKDAVTAQLYCAIVTQFTGRPCRLAFSRKESLIATAKRHSAEIDAKMGFSKNGKLLAFEGKMVLDTGAYAMLGPAVLSLASEHFAGPYEVEHVKIDSYLCYTNHAPASAMRGFGAPQGAFAAETLMNRAAEQLGINPIALRRQNALLEGSLGSIGQPMEHSVGFCAALDLFERSDFWHRASENKDPTIGYGIAAGFMSSGLGKGIPDTATVSIQKLADDYIVKVGLVDIGQGSRTALTMIAAEALSVDLSKITLIMADTTLTENSGSTAGSRSCYIGGNAIVAAAQKLLRENTQYAEATAAFPENSADAPIPGLPHTLYSFIVQGAKVKVDRVTGLAHILELHSTTEAGTIINPTSMAGQIFGGAGMSVGYTLCEEIRRQDGIPIETDFSNYLLPTAMDMPYMTSETVPAHEQSGPFGLKGVAEAATVALAPATANAIHKIAPSARLVKLPLDPEEILAGLRPI